MATAITVDGSCGPINSNSLENFVAGAKGEQGQLSPVRRFFCLFVTFDVLFTGLLWLICLVLSAHNLIIYAIEDEVLHYGIHKSLFDVVMLAATRSILLLLMYGLIRLNHWWAVALTTLGTSAFLVNKVFFYKWDEAEANSTFGVVLLLSSFILAWGEVWLLDFRVFPREQAMVVASRSRLDEQTPLLRGYVPSVAGQSSYYSPIASPAESDDEDEITCSYVEREGYRRKAQEALVIACNALNSDGWQIECAREGDIIYSKKSFKERKIYKFVGTITAPPQLVFQELHTKLEESPKWNQSLIYCKVLQTIDERLDITYHVAAEGGAGLVSSRDFVNLRTWEKRGDDYVSAGISINHEKMPLQKTYVRGENGPCAWTIECIPGEPNVCSFHWLLHTDLKGWLPQYLIDQTLAGVMLDFIHHLRNHLSNLS